MRTVAVTGASGLIGTVLTAALEKRGDRVAPVGRHPPDGGVAWDLAALARELETDRIVNPAG